MTDPVAPRIQKPKYYFRVFSGSPFRMSNEPDPIEETNAPKAQTDDVVRAFARSFAYQQLHRDNNNTGKIFVFVAIALVVMLGLSVIFLYCMIPDWVWNPIKYINSCFSAFVGFASITSWKIPTLAWPVFTSSGSFATDPPVSVSVPNGLATHPISIGQLLGPQTALFENLTDVLPNEFAIVKSIGHLELSTFSLISSVDASDLPCKAHIKDELYGLIKATKKSAPAIIDWVVEMKVIANQ